LQTAANKRRLPTAAAVSKVEIIMAEVLWVVAGLGSVFVLYFLYLGSVWVYERVMLDPEERWRRRYDRRMKKHFKSMY
jgi:hypothetical protein